MVCLNIESVIRTAISVNERRHKAYINVHGLHKLHVLETSIGARLSKAFVDAAETITVHLITKLYAKKE